jgi:uncharacterized membrane protein
VKYFSVLVFFHIVSIALFTGSWAALLVMWWRAGQMEPGSKEPLVAALVTAARFASIVAGSLVILVGLLMIMVQPQVLALGGRFHTKLFLGVLAVGLSHVAAGRLKKLHNTIKSDGATKLEDKAFGRLGALVMLLVIVVIYLGISLTHG